MYKKVSSALNFVEREREVLEFWKQNQIFEKSGELRASSPVFSFYDGPPTANGKPHIGHILTRVIKDIIPRYKTMKGYKVPRKAGWDTHGLPVELEVEKLLGLSGKPQIEQYGIEAFNKQCRESVWKYQNEWEVMSDRVGYWVDMKDPYITYDNKYIESVWWGIKQIYDQGLLYKGHKIVPYCPRCGTSLSSHEVAQGYKDVKEMSTFVKFKAVGEDNTYFLAWTTTPWTLPSNVALTVNPREDYITALHNNEKIILAQALADKVLGEEAYEVLSTCKGKELEGREYLPLYDWAKPAKKAYYVCCGDFVTLSDGSGIVHTAPAFGEDDAKVGREYDLPFVQLVDNEGNFLPSTEFVAGKFVKDADPLIIADLEARGLMFKKLPYEHSYPFCWRCDTPLLYYALDTWFVRTTAVKEKLIANNRSVNWIPENIKDGRMGNFLENVVDWGLSRSRYWGTPLPVWECSCGHFHAIGSIEELRALGKDVPADIELHRPYVDGITIPCEKCGGTMERVSDVIDCWFDSGSMPFAQWHYPFENQDKFAEFFPADFISEAIDQTRGWFYVLLTISTLLFDKAPFKNCIVLGHVNDKDGFKMSKHKGNVVNPDVVLDKQGADAVRWYFYTNSAPWLPSRFYEEAVSESQRKFMGTFWNVYSFYVLYAEIDKFNPTAYSLDKEELSIMDKWILSRLNTLIGDVDKALEDYRITEAGRAIQDFTDELSNWYIRRGRERYWVDTMTPDKISAYMTLYTVLSKLSLIAAPFVPFMCENIYQNITRTVDCSAPESIHLCDYPIADETMIDKSLEDNMDAVLRLVVLGRAARNAAVMKNRQPLAALYVKSAFKLDDAAAELVLDELNVKRIEYVDDTSAFVDYKFKPQLKTVGPKYGKILPKINAYLAEGVGRELYAQLNANGKLATHIDGVDVELTADDLLIETIRSADYVSESDRDETVVLDLRLSDALIEEGFVRELVNKIQTMRKEAGFEVMDKIKVYYTTTEKLAAVIEKNSAEISAQVLANSIAATAPAGYVKDWSINGEACEMGVEKV